MTDRCQTKFTEKYENQNYIIYGGILVASLAVLYCYRFHFATIVFSYGLGCVACYYGLISNILDSLVDKIKCHSALRGDEYAAEEIGNTDCATCGSSSCARHDSEASPEPWVGLHIHKQLDQAIEDLYTAVLEQWVGAWHGRLASRAGFALELRAQLRRASALLLRRALRVNYPRFLLERLLPCALRHYSQCRRLEAGGALALHPAAASRAAELRYLRSVVRAVAPLLLPPAELHNAVSRVLVRELLAGWVLLPLADALADPHVLNALVVFAAGPETAAPLPATPDYRVEFLAAFARPAEAQAAERARLLRVDLELLLAEPQHLYAFMRHLTAAGQLPLLHFYKDIKLFQTKLLNPSLSGDEQAALCREGGALLARAGALLPGGAPPRGGAEPVADVKRLQTSPALYAAARAAHERLDRLLLPRFLHSDEFYKILIGSRIPTGYQKQSKRPAPARAAAGRRAPAPGAAAGAADPADPGDPDDPDDPDDRALLAYLDRLAADELHDPDLTIYKVVITKIETRLQAPPRRGTVRVFALTVQCAAPDAPPGLWDVERSEHDFHLLRGKLLEFHGERALSDLPLPSRRDNSPPETLRYKYEDFLQRALRQPLLRGSALLRLFLSGAADFALLASAAAALGAAPDLAHVYRAVTLRLRKEKGQHLETFLRDYLLSADMERYHALKTGAGVEEALEVSEERAGGGGGGGAGVGGAGASARRELRSPVFGDNFGVEPVVERRDRAYQDRLRGFTQCLMYLLRRVVRARGCVARAAGGALAGARAALDAAAERALAAALARALPPRRLARLVRLGHGLIFGKRSSTPRSETARQCAAARAQLRRAVPRAAHALLPGLGAALDAALDLLQRPALNKQLVYNLLDLCIVELFPELCAADIKSANRPKS